jgi:hypothetical protein
MYTEFRKEDLQILTFIDSHPFLNSYEINLFFGYKLNTLRKRLRVLNEYKYVSYIISKNYGGYKYYFTTNSGHKNSLNANSKYFKRDNQSIKLFLFHDIESNKFFIKLKEFSLENKIEFSNWVSDIYTKIEFRYSGRPFTLIPDGFVNFAGLDIYLELDRGTEDFFKILKKIEYYSNFYLSLEYKKYFQKFPNVIFIIPDEKRKALMKSKVSDYLNINKYKDELDFFKFFTKDEFYSNPKIIYMI